jgi:hypothetical protein
MKTIYECASNGLIIVADVDNKGNPTGKYSVFSASGAWTQRSFSTPAEAIVAIKKAKGALWELLSQKQYEGFVIVAELDDDKELTDKFYVFTLSANYETEDLPTEALSLAKAHEWIKNPENVGKQPQGIGSALKLS